jgi:hypothetical protein
MTKTQNSKEDFIVCGHRFSLISDPFITKARKFLSTKKYDSQIFLACPVSVIDYWDLGFIWCLDFGI